MESNQELIAQIDELFHPRSVAIVGAPRGLKSGSVFLMALLEQGFPGKIYPVNPRSFIVVPRIERIITVL